MSAGLQTCTNARAGKETGAGLPSLVAMFQAVYLVGVRPVLVFGPVRRVGESFVAAFVLADVGFLSGVGAQMGFQVLQTGVGLGAALELRRKTGNESVSESDRNILATFMFLR